MDYIKLAVHCCAITLLTLQSFDRNVPNQGILLCVTEAHWFRPSEWYAVEVLIHIAARAFFSGVGAIVVEVNQLQKYNANVH